VLAEADARRIEEERAGVARPAPRTLASSHLLSALNALDDASSPEPVLSPRRTWPLRPGDPPQAFRTLADIIQRDLCCTAALFTAFTAEAHVNDFLSVHLPATRSPKRGSPRSIVGSPGGSPGALERHVERRRWRA
jgi:hypothetical protein